MADMQELERALINADAAGDADAARKLAGVIMQMRSAAPQPPALTAEPITRGERFAQGLRDPLNGGAQLLTKILPSSVVEAGNKANNWLADKTGLVGRLPEGGVGQQIREQEAKYEAGRAAAGQSGMDFTRAAGSLANPVTWAPGGVVAKAASLPGRMAAGAASGGLMALLNPVQGDDYALEKAKQVGAGAALGGLIPGIASGIGRLISPKASTDPAIQLLRSEGVSPTIGQTMGGVANKLEERLTSLPIMGDAIAAGRRRAADQLNAAVANRALTPIGESLPKGMQGREAVGYVQSKLGDAYDNLLPKMTVKADQTFAQELSSLRNMVANGSIDPQAAKAFGRIVQNDVLGKFRGQQALTGQTFKQIEGDLFNQIKRFGQSQDADQRLVGDALKELQSSLRSLAQRSNPQLAKELGDINLGYANFKRLEKAAGSLGAEDGIFSAAQLQSAVKALDRSKDKGQFARGGALMQDLSDAAKTTLGSKVPNSGTPERLMVGVGGLGAGLLNPAIPLGLAGGAIPYSPWGQSLLSLATSARPAAAKKIAGLLEQSSPMFAPAGGLLGAQMLPQ
jgi:hypothetical protein